MKNLRRTILQVNCLKLQIQEKPSRTFSLAYNLPKTMPNLCPSHQKYVKKSKLKQRAYFDHRNSQIKIRGNNMDFSTIEMTSTKVRGNNVDFLISEITSKKNAEMTWKFVEIWSSTYRRNTHVESTWI